MTAPDVSVVVPVYNTMPYLVDCLESLLAQTLKRDRFEVIAVDDGSTDGGGEVLDQYAAAHPDLFRVVHQPNSGGPAAPCNVGIDLAEGRYLFFLGADDELGVEALERMVRKADEWNSDVVCVKLIGVGDREIGLSLFSEDVEDLPFPDLRPFIFANTKLYRTSLVRKHGIRYPEHMRAASDQPFTIAAMMHARKTSVLSDYDYYLATARDDGSNITYDRDWRSRLRDVATLMGLVEEIVPAGDARDRILQRHFRWEMANKLRDRLAEMPEHEQREFCQRVAELAARHWTPGIKALLQVQVRLRIGLARVGAVDALHELNSFIAEGDTPELVLTEGGARLVYPGRVQTLLDESWFDVTAHQSIRWRINATTRDLRSRGDVLQADVEVDVAPRSAVHLTPVLCTGPTQEVEIRPGAEMVVAEGQSAGHSVLTLTFPVDELVRRSPHRTTWRVRLEAKVIGAAQSVSVRCDHGKAVSRLSKPSPVRVVARPLWKSDRLAVAVVPETPEENPVAASQESG